MAMECTLIMERMINLALPATTLIQWPLFIITLCIWGCVTYLIRRLLIELNSATLTLFQIAYDIANIVVRESFVLTREILQVISQMLTCLYLSFFSLIQLMKVSVVEIWANLTKDNLSFLLTLTMIIYIFPDLCDVIKNMLRRCIIS